jgi:hypothetical protein
MRPQTLNAIDRSIAAQERQRFFDPPCRDHQIAFAFLEAAGKNAEHPLAQSIGRVARQIAEKE